MANIVQNPSQRPGVAIVLRGSRGVGKGVFANEFGKIFGRHFLHLENPRHLTGHFNHHLKDKLVVFSDEAFWAGDKTAEGVIKSMITEAYITIEAKGQNAISVDNHISLIMASNNDWIVPAAPDERRFCVLDVGDQHAQDTKYFERIINQMNSGGREALLDYLLNYDLSDVDLRDFPHTEALFEQVVQSFSRLDRFWFDILSRGWILDPNDGWSKQVIRKDLQDSYLRASKDIGQLRRSTETELGIYLEKNVPGLKKGDPYDSFYGRKVGIYRLLISPHEVVQFHS